MPAPVGYLDMGQGKPKELDPAKAPLIRKTFELYSTGKYSLDKLVEEISVLGLRNRRNKKISKNGLSTILNNPFYIGLIHLNSSGETFQGVHAPLISASLFKRVQSILNGKMNTKIQKHDFTFRRMFDCRHCGQSVIGEKQKGFIYYRCHNGCRPTTCVRENIMDEKVEDIFSMVSLNEIELMYLEQRTRKLKEDKAESHLEQKKAVELNIQSLQERLNRVTDAYIDRLIGKEDFENRKASLFLEKKGMEEKLQELELGINSRAERMGKFLELLRRLYFSYKLGLPEKKREFLETATSNRFVEGKNVELELQIPFNMLAERSKNSNGGPYRARPRTKLDRLFKKLCDYFEKQSHN